MTVTKTIVIMATQTKIHNLYLLLFSENRNYSVGKRRRQNVWNYAPEGNRLSEEGNLFRSYYSRNLHLFKK